MKGISLLSLAFLTLLNPHLFLFLRGPNLLLLLLLPSQTCHSICVETLAAEYIQEVRSGEILGLEAVVVSDLPGLVGQAATTGAQELKMAQEGAGHGWAETARSALLMATATFLEEVLDMG